MHAPLTGWAPELTRMREASRQRERSFEAIGLHDEVVPLDLAWEKGSLVVRTGSIRLTVLSDKSLELQVSALAIEIEGLESWVMREIPRWLWWAKGVRVADSKDWRELEERLTGWIEQRRIEICIDMLGLDLEYRFKNGRGIEDALIGRPAVRSQIPQPGVRTGFEIGRRRPDSRSMAIYRKLLELDVRRAPEKEALLEQFRAAGWDGKDDIVRIELRPEGSALCLVNGQREVVDGKRPLAALHDDVVQALWCHGLGELWIADLDGGYTRPRDNPVWLPWQVARDAARDVQPFRARRAPRKAQLASLERHIVGQLEQSLADVEVIRGTQNFEDVGPKARAEVERALCSPRARDRFTRSMARHGDLVRASADDSDAEDSDAVDNDAVNDDAVNRDV